MVLMAIRERIGPECDRITSELLVCYLFRSLQSASYTSGGSALNVGGQNQNPSRLVVPPIIPPKPAKYRKARVLPNNSSPNHLGQHNQSSTSI